MKLEFKITGGKSISREFSDPSSTSVLDVKTAVLEESGFSTIRLIYKGKILKDEESLTGIGIEDGHVLHIVRGPGAITASTTTAPTTTAPAVVAPTGPTMESLAANATTPPVAPPPPMPANFMGFPGAGAPGGMGLPAGMDPAQMGQMLQNPAFQQMLSQLSQNPELMAQMMQQNPMMQQMAQNNPQVAAMLQNPQLLAAMMNPQVLNSLNTMMNPNSPNPLTSHPVPAQATPPANIPPATTAPPFTTVPTATAAPPVNPAFSGGMDPQQMATIINAAQQNPALAQALGLDRLLNSAGDGYVSAPIPPASLAELETRYADQLTQLNELGFSDKNANLEALRVTEGNVELAVNYLFDQGFGN